MFTRPDLFLFVSLFVSFFFFLLLYLESLLHLPSCGVGRWILRSHCFGTPPARSGYLPGPRWMRPLRRSSSGPQKEPRGTLLGSEGAFWSPSATLACGSVYPLCTDDLESAVTANKNTAVAAHTGACRMHQYPPRGRTISQAPSPTRPCSACAVGWRMHKMRYRLYELVMTFAMTTCSNCCDGYKSQMLLL